MHASTANNSPLQKAFLGHFMPHFNEEKITEVLCSWSKFFRSLLDEVNEIGQGRCWQRSVGKTLSLSRIYCILQLNHLYNTDCALVPSPFQTAGEILISAAFYQAHISCRSRHNDWLINCTREPTNREMRMAIVESLIIPHHHRHRDDERRPRVNG